jgi:cation transport regulator
MPYDTLSDLPDSVKNSLPKHGQEIYQAAYNSAFDEYADASERRDPSDSREETAHKVAWSAVKKEYEKQGSRWVRKGE